MIKVDTRQQGKREKEISEVLQELGYRITPQRMMILEAIQSSDGHISADEIYDQVRRKYPHVNISTVYRTLELLRALRLVTETDLGEGRIKYHLAEKGKHHHLVCQSCGAILELDESVLIPLKNTLRRDYQFDANLSHFAIFGHCAKCRQDEGDRY